MFDKNYKAELDNFVLSDEFKQQTVQLMNEKAAGLQPESSSAKTVFFPKKAIRNAVAVCLILIIGLTGNAVLRGSFSFDSATEESRNDFPGNQKDSDTDSLTQEQSRETVNSAFLYSAEDRINIENNKTTADNLRVVLTIDNSGGMGFESYTTKSLRDLEQNPTFTVGDKFDTLPVYRAEKPDAELYTEEINSILDKMEVDCDPLTYVWMYPVYDDEGHHISNKSIKNNSPTLPGDEYFISGIQADFTDKYGLTGDIDLWAGRGTLRIALDDYIAESEDKTAVMNRLCERYPDLSEEIPANRIFYDYNIYGEKYDWAYMYNSSEDYGHNIFNFTANNTNISRYTTRNGQMTIFNYSIPSYWQRAADLPAIDYKQALSLLYDGVYYTSYPGGISPDDKVAHIEIVYKYPNYNMPFEKFEGYALPFYQFFVDITDKDNINFEQVGLRNYAAFYVCAIHPDYIEIDENSDYAAFN